MQSLRQKLTGRCGASIVIALLLLLVCTVVGALVLTASTVNMGQNVYRQKAHEEYLAVMSAAELINSDLQELSYRGSYTVTDVSYSVTASDGSTSSSGTPGGKVFGSAAFLGGQLVNESVVDLQQAYKQYAGLPGVIPPVAQQYFDFTVDADNDSIPTVSGVLLYDPTTFDVTVTLQAKRDGEQDGYTMTMRLDAEFINSESSASSTVYSESTDPETGVITSTAETTTVTTYDTTITWQPPLYEKGGSV